MVKNFFIFCLQAISIAILTIASFAIVVGLFLLGDQKGQEKIINQGENLGYIEFFIDKETKEKNWRWKELELKEPGEAHE